MENDSRLSNDQVRDLGRAALRNNDVKIAELCEQALQEGEEGAEARAVIASLKCWRIISSEGLEMGTYLGSTSSEALEAMAQDAGYRSLADAEASAGTFKGSVEELDTIKWASAIYSGRAWADRVAKEIAVSRSGEWRKTALDARLLVPETISEDDAEAWLQECMAAARRRWGEIVEAT